MPCNTTYRYIIAGNGSKALPVHSDLTLSEFTDLIRNQSQKIHPESRDTIWRWSFIEFVNPQVYTVDDFANGAHSCPAFIGIK